MNVIITHKIFTIIKRQMVNMCKFLNLPFSCIGKLLCLFFCGMSLEKKMLHATSVYGKLSSAYPNVYLEPLL